MGEMLEKECGQHNSLPLLFIRGADSCCMYHARDSILYGVLDVFSKSAMPSVSESYLSGNSFVRDYHPRLIRPGLHGQDVAMSHSMKHKPGTESGMSM